MDYFPKKENNYKTIKDWREDEKPREKLVSYGPSYLSDSELLAILLRTGAKGFNALDAAKKLLDDFGNLTNLSVCDLSQLKSVKSLGNVKAITLVAAFELAKRIQAEPFENRKSINGPNDIAKIYIPKMRGVKVESFHAILLSSSNQIIRDVLVSTGTLNSSIVHPREVFKYAITESAASIILLHNHPSGRAEPSTEDKNITKQLVEAGKLIDIRINDHIIIAGEAYYSFATMGQL